MAQKTQQIARLPRSSNPICLTRQALNRLAYPPSGRAASTNSTDIRYPSNVLPEPKPQLLSQSLFQSTSPIRRVVEPASIDTARSMHLRRSRRKYAYFPPSGNSDQSINGPYSEPSVMRLNPGQKVRRVGPRVGPRVGNVDPFRDIYYVPPKRAGKTWNSPLNSKNTQQYSNNNPPAEPQNRFHPQATSTVPYRNPALRRFPKQQPLFPQQHQKSNLSTSSTRLNPVPSPSPETIDIDQYHRLADHYIDNLVTKLEAIQERRDEVDCEYTVCLSSPHPLYLH